MQGFEYPTKPQIRRHAPEGYQDYESYRDWLRDEFMFRCVYCLHRERWYGRATTFNIDHLNPVAANLRGKLEYANLVYACASCNNAKRAILGVPDPCNLAFAECVRIMEDGQIESLNEAGESLIKKLRLNNQSNIKYRFRLMRIFRTLQEQDSDLYRELMAFPDELPDLRTKKVPRNSRPESVGSCYFALRERGELPATY
jgi:hypothetical protein